MAWVVCALAPGGLTLAASGRGTPSIHASQFADLRHGDQGSAGGSATHRRSRQAGRGTWSCVLLSNMTLAEGVWWTKQNCTGTVPEALDPHVGPIIVNIGHAALSTTSASVANPPMIRPGVARTPLGLAKLHDIAANTSVEVPGFKPLIGVNGGYFFEVRTFIHQGQPPSHQRRTLLHARHLTPISSSHLTFLANLPFTCFMFPHMLHTARQSA